LNSGVHDGAGADLDAFALQQLADLSKQGLTQLVFIEQFTKFEQGGGIGYGLATQINAHKAAQAATVVQGFFARLNQC
jgi:hypothetical protein